MKIILQLSPDQVHLVFGILKTIENLQPTVVPAERLTRSMLLEVYDRFTSINKRFRNSGTTIHPTKKRKVILKYFEAHALQMLLNDIDSLSDDYYTSLLISINEDLKQALA